MEGSARLWDPCHSVRRNPATTGCPSNTRRFCQSDRSNTEQRMSPPPPTAPRRAGNSHPLPECGAERRPKAIREPGGGGRTQGIWASGSSGCNTRETWPRAWPPGREVTLFCEMPEAHVLPTADVPTGYRARLFQQPSLFTSSRQRWNG